MFDKNKTTYDAIVEATHMVYEGTSAREKAQEIIDEIDYKISSRKAGHEKRKTFRAGTRIIVKNRLWRYEMDFNSDGLQTRLEKAFETEYKISLYRAAAIQAWITANLGNYYSVSSAIKQVDDFKKAIPGEQELIMFFVLLDQNYDDEDYDANKSEIDDEITIKLAKNALAKNLKGEKGTIIKVEVEDSWVWNRPGPQATFSGYRADGNTRSAQRNVIELDTGDIWGSSYLYKGYFEPIEEK